MSDEIVFFLYIIAGSAGIVGILQILMLVRYGNAGNWPLFRSMCMFMISTVMLDFLYLGYDYYHLKTGHYDSTTLLRILDIELFIVQPWFWTEYIRTKSQMLENTKAELAKRSHQLFGIAATLGLIGYGLMMQGYYEPVSARFVTISIWIEIIINVILVFVVIWHMMTAVGNIVQKKSRNRIILVSLGICLNEIMNGVLSVSILMGRYMKALEHEFDVTPLCFLLINITAVIVLFGEDFSALFTTKQGDPAVAPPAEEPAAVITELPSAALYLNPQMANALAAPTLTAGVYSDPEKGSQPASAAERFPEETGEEINDPEGSDVPHAEEPEPADPVKARLDHIAEKHFLTVREREVLELCYDGMTNPEIAETLFISMNTVKRHLHNIFEKMDVSTRIELVHMVNNSKSN